VTRSTLNVTTGDLDVLRRLDAAQRELEEIANDLLYQKTSKKERRQEHGRRLNAIKASLKTVTLTLEGEL
jgi:hypothetical protein